MLLLLVLSLAWAALAVAAPPPLNIPNDFDPRVFVHGLGDAPMAVVPLATAKKCYWLARLPPSVENVTAYLDCIQVGIPIPPCPPPFPNTPPR